MIGNNLDKICFLVTLISVIVINTMLFNEQQKTNRLENDIQVKNILLQNFHDKFSLYEHQKESYNGIDENFCRICQDCSLHPSRRIVLDKCLSIHFNESVTWENARKSCKADGGDLATLQTLLDVDSYHYILSLAFPEINNKPEVSLWNIWVGATDQDNENEWFWVNGEKVDNQHPRWKDTLLDDFGSGEEDCLIIGLNMKDNYWGLWDQPCSTKLHYLCQFN